jgi:hypothetical protein
MWAKCSYLTRWLPRELPLDVMRIYFSTVRDNGWITVLYRVLE